jgi:DinB superfamily
VCHVCTMDYAATGLEDVMVGLAQVPDEVAAAATAVPLAVRAVRPKPRTWSVIEYACHVRDVYASYTIRLFRTRTEQRPVLEPMLNDLRAVRFRYRDRQLGPVLDELAAHLAGFCDEIDRTNNWTRTATRLPGEERSALWLVRQALHEGRHHTRDIEAVGRAVTT